MPYAWDALYSVQYYAPRLPPVAPLTLADPPPDCGLEFYLSLHGNQLVSIKESMCWGEHGVLYAANESLNTPTET